MAISYAPTKIGTRHCFSMMCPTWKIYMYIAVHIGVFLTKYTCIIIGILAHARFYMNFC